MQKLIPSRAPQGRAPIGHGSHATQSHGVTKQNPTQYIAWRDRGHVEWQFLSTNAAQKAPVNQADLDRIGGRVFVDRVAQTEHLYWQKPVARS